MRQSINIGLAVVVLAAAGLGSWWLVATKPVPAHVTQAPLPPAVVVETAAAQDAAWPVVGFGSVRAQHQVDVVPQVSGRLVEVHDDLAQGKTIERGELLFQIDRTIYESRVAQAEAEVRRLETMLERYDIDRRQLDRRITNAERMLEVLKEEYETTQALADDPKNPAANLAQVRADEQRYLKQQDVVAELTSRRELLPLQQAETQALLDAARARLDQAKLELAHTEIRCPFDARVESVAAYTSEVVTAYFGIAQLTSLEAFEIPVGIDPRDLRWLSRAAHPDALRGDAGVEPGSTRVRVWSTVLGVEHEWTGYVARFERMDEATRTARMVVEVRHDDLVTRPAAGVASASGRGRSLAIGMFCRAELPGRELDGALLVPRHAVHDNQWVYVFEPDPIAGDGARGRLARRHVPLLRSVGDQVLVDFAGRSGDADCELQPGEQVIVSALPKPVDGMEIRLQGSLQVAGLSHQPAEALLGQPAQPQLLPPVELATATAGLAQVWAVLAPVEAPHGAP